MTIIANIFGCFAIIIWSMSIQNKEKRKILTFQTVANIFYSLQYFLLKTYTASILNLLSAIRCIVFYYDEKKNNKVSNITFILFIIITIIIGITTYREIFDLIPVICTLIYMYSLWQNNLNITRYLFIIAAILLAYHNFKVGAYVCIIGNTMDIVSAIISIIRFRKK